MLPLIGDFDFLGWDGRLKRPTRRVSVLQPPVGVDGVAVAFDGWTCEESTITTKDILATVAAANQWGESYKALEDDPPLAITVTDPTGTVWQNVLVLGVQYEVDVRTDNQAQITATWRLLPTNV